MTTASLSTASSSVSLNLLTKADLDLHERTCQEVAEVYFSTFAKATEALFEKNKKAYFAKKREDEIASNQEELEIVNSVLAKANNTAKAPVATSEGTSVLGRIGRAAAFTLGLVGVGYAAVLVKRGERPTLEMVANDGNTVVKAVKGGVKALYENVPSKEGTMQMGRSLMAKGADLAGRLACKFLGLGEVVTQQAPAVVVETAPAVVAPAVTDTIVTAVVGKGQ